MAERLFGGQAHVLLLKRKAKLITERARDALGGGLDRTAETEPGFHGDDEDVDQLRQVIIDLLEPASGPAIDDDERGSPADEDGHGEAEPDQDGREPGCARKPKPGTGERQRGKCLVADELLRRRQVEPRGHQSVA